MTRETTNMVQLTEAEYIIVLMRKNGTGEKEDDTGN